MKEVKIRVSTIQDVHTFAALVGKHNIDVDLSSGRYVVDAKSIMGIFSLDLTKPIKVEVHTENTDAIATELKPYMAE